MNENKNKQKVSDSWEEIHELILSALPWYRASQHRDGNAGLTISMTVTGWVLYRACLITTIWGSVIHFIYSKCP